MAAARKAYSRNRYRQAHGLCRKALRQAPEDRDAASICGLAACKLGDASAARRYLALLPAPYRDGVAKHCAQEGIALDAQ